MASAFHLIALPLASEEAVLAAALEALAEADAGDSVFFSEALAWTASGSGIAYTRMVRAARELNLNIVGSLNLGGELAEDLPGKKPSARYHAVAIFTRHGHVHVPQGKVFPDALERSVGPDEEALPVVPYTRSNLIRLDMEEQLIEVRFLLGADLAILLDQTPRALACDVLIASTRVPIGAEEKVTATLAEARAAGIASTTLAINGYGTGARGEVLCIKLEDAADSGKAIPAKARWGNRDQLQRRFYRYAASRRGSGNPSSELERLNRDPKRKGRIPILRPPRAPKVELGVYPVTIVL